MKCENDIEPKLLEEPEVRYINENIQKYEKELAICAQLIHDNCYKNATDIDCDEDSEEIEYQYENLFFIVAKMILPKGSVLIEKGFYPPLSAIEIRFIDERKIENIDFNKQDTINAYGKIRTITIFGAMSSIEYHNW